MSQPAVVMILCHEQESITSVGIRRSGKEGVKSPMYRCDFVGGSDLEEEGEMVLDLTTDFKFFRTTAQVREHFHEHNRNTSFLVHLHDNTSALVALMGGQSLEIHCRNGGQSSPSAISNYLLYDSPVKSVTTMISSNSHSNVSETSPPSVASVKGSPDCRLRPVQLFECHPSRTGCVASVNVDGMELDS
jgi:hypothetical protein